MSIQDLTATATGLGHVPCISKLFAYPLVLSWVSKYEVMYNDYYFVHSWSQKHCVTFTAEYDLFIWTDRRRTLIIQNKFPSTFSQSVYISFKFPLLIFMHIPNIICFEVKLTFRTINRHLKIEMLGLRLVPF